MSTKHLRLLVVVFVTFFVAHASFGQECRVTTTVRILDEHGNPFLNVTPEQFSAKIGGNPAKVISAAEGTKPVTMLLIDISSSMKEAWEQSVAAAKQLSANAGDRVAVVVFRDQILDHASGREATTRLLDRLATQKTSMGGTALYDTLIQVAGAAKNPNTALVVIGDGHDNASRNSSDQTINWFLKNRWPPVFALVMDFAHEPARPGFKKIVTETGGLAGNASSASKVAEAATQLSAAINTPFTITMQPSQTLSKPEKLEIEVIGADGKQMHGVGVSHIAEISACDAVPIQTPRSE